MMIAATTQSTTMQSGGRHRVLATKQFRCCHSSLSPCPARPATSSHGVEHLPLELSRRPLQSPREIREAREKLFGYRVRLRTELYLATLRVISRVRLWAG